MVIYTCLLALDTRRFLHRVYTSYTLSHSALLLISVNIFNIIITQKTFKYLPLVTFTANNYHSILVYLHRERGALDNMVKLSFNYTIQISIYPNYKLRYKFLP